MLAENTVNICFVILVLKTKPKNQDRIYFSQLNIEFLDIFGIKLCPVILHWRRNYATDVLPIFTSQYSQILVSEMLANHCIARPLFTLGAFHFHCLAGDGIGKRLTTSQCSNENDCSLELILILKWSKNFGNWQF